METLTDAELLRIFRDKRSEVAFRQIVQRHAPSVYAIALRQTGGDAHLARDVVQLVFVALSRKASALARYRSLGGWLYRTTNFVAADVVRAETRRRAREQAAQTMTEISSVQRDDIDWSALRAPLDRLIGQLKQADRDVLWLRFFENTSYPEIAARLGVTENTARMKVERALAKLHASLARRGVSCTMMALSKALAHQGGSTLPADLGVSVICTAAAAPPVSALPGTGILFMSTTKIISLGAIVGLAALIGLLWPHSSSLKKEPSRLIENSRPVPQDKTAARLPPEGPSPTAEPQPSPVEVPRASGNALRPATLPTDAGTATPEDTLSTLLWAANTAEITIIADTLTLSPEAAQKAETLFARLPEQRRAEYGSVERLLALLLGSAPVVVHLEVLGNQPGAVDPIFGLDLPHEPATRTLEVRLTYADGRMRENTMLFRQTPEGWRWLIVPGMIDKFGSVLTGEVPVPPARAK